MGRFMKKYRFLEIRQNFVSAFSDPGRADDDPWWQVIPLIEDYNKNRGDRVAASYIKVADETMSSYRPLTMKLGDLPHLSFIKFKPEPLGTELKVGACAQTKSCLWLEIQRGREGMKE